MDDLTKLLHWILSSPLGLITLAPTTGVVVLDHSSVATACLFRSGPWQAELVLMKGGSPEWPGEHRHPNVDSYEVAISYPIPFIKNGKLLSGPELVVRVPGINDRHVDCNCVRLLPTDWHKAPVMPESGGVVLSVQRWLNDVEPTSVGLDWIGEPTTEGHRKQIEKVCLKH